MMMEVSLLQHANTTRTNQAVMEFGTTGLPKGSSAFRAGREARNQHCKSFCTVHQTLEIEWLLLVVELSSVEKS